MAVTQILAIHATQSLLLQRIFVPSLDDSEINGQPVLAGETSVRLPVSVYKTGGPQAVQAQIGTPTFSGRCAVVDATNKVIDLIVADPALYNDARGHVIPSDNAMHGDSWDGVKFNRLYLEVDTTTGLVAAIPTMQPILSPAPKINPKNMMVVASVAPNALPGATVPMLTAKIVASVAATKTVT